MSKWVVFGSLKTSPDDTWSETKPAIRFHDFVWHSITSYNLPWPSMTFHDLPWGSTFYSNSGDVGGYDDIGNGGWGPLNGLSLVMIIIVILRGETGSVDFLTICLVPDDKWNSLLDANPMIFLCDIGNRFVNPSMTTFVV